MGRTKGKRIVGSQRYSRDLQRTTVDALRARGWVSKMDAAAALFSDTDRLWRWANKGYIRRIKLFKHCWVYWPEVCAHVWRIEPDLAMALSLPQASRCIVCGEVIKLSADICPDCEVVKPKRKLR